MMNSTTDRAAAEAKMQASANQAFERWLGLPQIKLVISMLPRSEPPEATSTMLRAAFDAGTVHGSGETMMQIADVMLRADKRKDY